MSENIAHFERNVNLIEKYGETFPDENCIIAA
jgi:hypothetical protein